MCPPVSSSNRVLVSARSGAAPDTHIFIDQGYVDAHIVYPLRESASEISIRTTAAPEFGV